MLVAKNGRYAIQSRMVSQLKVLEGDSEWVVVAIPFDTSEVSEYELAVCGTEEEATRILRGYAQSIENETCR